MPTRLTRPLLIALFACVHLVLQPLAVSAPCAWIGGGSLDCCCAPAAEDEEAPSSCCASKDEAPSPSDEAPAPQRPEPCECAVAPAQPPATTPEIVESVSDPVALGPALGTAFLDAQASAFERRPVLRATGPPGHGPSRHLRLQVFRL